MNKSPWPDGDPLFSLSDASQFLRKATGKEVSVKLFTGSECHGTLSCLDGYMNVALEGGEEHDGDSIERLGDVFIRGNNVFYIAIKEN